VSSEVTTAFKTIVARLPDKLTTLLAGFLSSLDASGVDKMVNGANLTDEDIFALDGFLAQLEAKVVKQRSLLKSKLSTRTIRKQ
jgi:hypothetical protein